MSPPTKDISRNRKCPVCNRQFYINPNYVGFVDCNNCGSKLYYDQLIEVENIK